MCLIGTKRSQKVIWVNENQEMNLKGAILPLIAVAGTITRRAVESTWLTASNYMVLQLNLSFLRSNM